MKWFGHVELMGSKRSTKRIYVSEIRGERGIGRPPLRWMDGVRRACAERGVGLEEAKEVCRDRNVWRRMNDRVV